MQCKIRHLLEAYDMILSYLKQYKTSRDIPVQSWHNCTDVMVFWCLCRAGKENSLNVIGGNDELK